MNGQQRMIAIIAVAWICFMIVAVVFEGQT